MITEEMEHAMEISHAQAKAYENGYRASMTRAAEICQQIDEAAYYEDGKLADMCHDAIIKARDGK